MNENLNVYSKKKAICVSLQIAFSFLDENAIE